MTTIRYAAPIWSATGYAQAAREMILALDRQGYRLVVDPFDRDEGGPDLGAAGERLRELVGRRDEATIQILHSPPDSWRTLRRGDAPTIGMTVWETDRIHPIWAKACNRVDEVWVPCRWNRDVFRGSGVETEIAIIPHVWEPPSVEPVLPAALRDLDDDVFVFYAIFQWRERKNPRELIETFLATFSRDPKVALVLKTYVEDLDEDGALLRQRLAEIKADVNVMRYAPILLITEQLSPAEVRGLHERGDCFVLLQRAEGWGYPHHEAASYGNPVITTGYGGVLDFLEPGDPFLIDYQLRPVTGEPRSAFYTADGRWAAPDLDQASRRMLRARERRAEDVERAERTRRRVRADYSPEVVGRLMGARIDALAERFGLRRPDPPASGRAATARRDRDPA